jgi:selenophosphate synthetase-related protein
MPDNKLANLSNADQFSAQELYAMQIMAKMRAKAEALGIPFAGGFITDDNKYFMTSSSDCDQSQIESITRQILGSDE